MLENLHASFFFLPHNIFLLFTKLQTKHKKLGTVFSKTFNTIGKMDTYEFERVKKKEEEEERSARES